MYAVKETFYTLQGEGRWTGRPAVFLRFSRCNLWSGREQDRQSEHTICKFCDTDFVGTDGPGGGLFKTAREVVGKVMAAWIANVESNAWKNRYVVCTGGEPLLQLDRELIDALHDYDFEIGVETNGTIVPPHGIDWICVSPKAGAELVLRRGNELKLVYPQAGAWPSFYETMHFDHFYLSPMDAPDGAQNAQKAIDYCMSHPQWNLSIQTHKVIGLP